MASVIEFLNEFRTVDGCAHGLQQSGLIGALRVAAVAPPSVDVIDPWMRGCIDEAVLWPDPPPGDADAVVRMLHRLMHWSIAVQNQARLAVSRLVDLEERPSAGAPGTREFRFAVPSASPKASALAFDWASQAIARLRTRDDAPDEAELRAHAELLRALRDLSERGLNNYYIAHAAWRLGMPVRRALPRVIAVGAGARERWFFSSITDHTSSLGVMFARDKQRTAVLLRRAGLPAPVHQPARTPQQAIEAAKRLGYPVVVKPADLDQGKGVAADLRSDAMVAEAFQAAAAQSRNVLVEKHFEGFTHRLTVFEGRLVKAVRRIAGGVVGDGERTVAELVARAQQEPGLRRRSARAGRPLLALDDEARGLLAQAGLDGASVLAPGRYLRLRRRDNQNAGGTNEQLALEAVHPDNRELAVRAAAVMRLDFAGIDLIIADVTKSWLETGALICEVNAQPQMGTADTPAIYEELLAASIPAGGRIPVRLVLAAAGPPPVDALLAMAPDVPAGQAVAHPDGLWLDGRRIAGAFPGGFEAADAALSTREANAVLCAMAPQEILRRGLPLARVDRLVVQDGSAADDAERAAVAAALAMIRHNADLVERMEEVHR